MPAWPVGRWLLRIDDLDSPRNRPGAEQRILADLRWLGLHWDGPLWRQSERRGLYGSVLSALRRAGLLYPCGCSRRLLADVSAPHGGWPLYPGFCRRRPLGWGPAAGRLPSWRLRLPPGPIRWQERLGRSGRLDGPGQVGDVVLRRADGVVAYHLATAVDELSLGISDVLRGEDLWPSTGAQVALITLLGAPPPRYGHLPLWLDDSGRRLSKREGAEGLDRWRQRRPRCGGGDRAAGGQRRPGAGGLAAQCPRAVGGADSRAFRRGPAGRSLHKGFGITGLTPFESGLIPAAAGSPNNAPPSARHTSAVRRSRRLAAGGSSLSALWRQWRAAP